MATRRMVPTRFFKDPDIMNLQSRDTQLILLGLILLADDEGRELAHPALIGRELDYPPEQIETALQDLATNDLLIIYQVGRHRYYSLTRWRQWQTLGSKMTPSKYPAPPETAEALISPEVSQPEPVFSGETPHHSGEILENPGKSGESSSQFNSIESNLGEGEEKPSSSVVIPFPQARVNASRGEQSREEDIEQITRQVAGNLKLAPTPALTRLVVEFLDVPGLCLPGEADAAREWIDEKKHQKQKKPQQMTLAFFRRWIKRERDQTLHRKSEAGSPPANRATGTFHQVPARHLVSSNSIQNQSLMHLEQEYRASHAERPLLSQRKE